MCVRCGSLCEEANMVTKASPADLSLLYNLGLQGQRVTNNTSSLLYISLH